MRAPTFVTETGWTDVALEAVERTLVTEQRVPAGSAHEYVVTEPGEAVATLCRLLRDRFEAVNSELEPPRVIIYAPSGDAAVSLAARLQGALFGTVTGDASAGLWGLSVLLPSAESRLETTLDEDKNTLSVLESSLRVMEMFACNRTSVLVTTASATRGLDFPQVTDVLNLGIVGSPADYVHRAGRVGRVGQLGRGAVVSVLCPSEVRLADDASLPHPVLHAACCCQGGMPGTAMDAAPSSDSNVGSGYVCVLPSCLLTFAPPFPSFPFFSLPACSRLRLLSQLPSGLLTHLPPHPGSPWLTLAHPRSHFTAPHRPPPPPTALSSQVSELLALGRELHFSPVERQPPPPTALAEVVRLSEEDEESVPAGEANEEAVQALADIYNLFDINEPAERPPPTDPPAQQDPPSDN